MRTTAPTALVLLFLVTGALAGPMTARADRTVEELAEVVASRTVQIFDAGAASAGRSISFGRHVPTPPAGVLVAGGRFALSRTGRYPVGDAVTVLLAGGIEIPGTVRFLDRETRVAVIELENSASVGGLEIRGTPLDMGEPVMAAGHPWGSERGDGGPAVGLGVVARVLRESAGAQASTYVVTPSVNPGDVGGPLVDRRGRLAGLLARRADEWSELATATPIRRILDVLGRDRPLSLLITAAPADNEGPATESMWPVHDRLRIVAEKCRRALLSVVVQRSSGATTATELVYSTAFLVGKGGFALTNLNFVAGAKTIRVVLHDGRRAAAVLLGEDERRGLAVLKLDVEDPPAGLVLADVAPAVGSFVTAVGAPPSTAPWHGPFMTIGIVGATNRDDRRFGALHTDAPVSEANLGGPLVDLAGRVVGMVSSVGGTAFNDVGVNSGIGFAIPGPSILENFERLVKGERIPYRPGYLGVTLSRDERETGGVEVLSVEAGHAAEKIGVKPGDVILVVEEQPIARLDDLRKLFVNFSAEQKIRLLINRDGNVLEFEATLGLRPQ